MKYPFVFAVFFVPIILGQSVSDKRKNRRNPFAESREVVAERNAFKREQTRKKNAAALKKHGKYCGIGETDDAIIVFVEWKDDLYDLCLGDIFGNIWSISMIDDDCMQVESIVDGDPQKLRKT